MNKLFKFLQSVLFIFLINQVLNAQLDARIGLGSLTMNVSHINAPDGASTIVFPREYEVYTQTTNFSMGSVLGGGFIIASRDFRTNWVYDSNTGNWFFVEPDTIVPYFVSEATARYYMDLLHSTVPIPNEFVRYWKYKAPLRVVDGVNYSDSDWEFFDEIGGVDMKCDQMIIASCNTASGITLTQKAYAFANNRFDDFIIVEYIFRNTGNIDDDEDIEYENNQVLDCYIGLKFKPQPSGLTQKIIPGAGGWNAQVDDWLDYYTGDYNDEFIRVMYGWDGDAASSFYSDDDEGDPLPASGIFMSPHYPGLAILHVDRAVNDPINDMNQPIMSYYSYGGANSVNALSIAVGGGVGAENIYEIMRSANFFSPFFDWSTWNASQIEIWRIDNNPNREHFKMGTLGFGPYNFNNIGDTVRIVSCYAVGCLGWQETVELGDMWRNGNILQVEKNRLIRSGRDSLFAKISQVSQVFIDNNGNFSLMKGAETIADPPEVPGLILNSKVRSVELLFTDVGASQYRVYRRLKPEFYLEDAPSELVKDPYPLIKELNPADLTHTNEGLFKWVDSEVVPGVNYWYAVTAVNEVGVESSKFQNRTDPNSNASTRGSVIPINDASTALDSVFVVPNPFHVKSQRLYNLPDDALIKFFGLPAQCRIRIYTQSGDLITSIHHEFELPPSNIEEWNLMTNSGQFIASGLYIFVVDQAKDGQGKDLGATKVGKFVVIR